MARSAAWQCDKGYQSGISIFEVALMLLILAITAGVVLKGQELVFSARSKGLMAQTERARVAFLGFQDRFRALPGDYRYAPGNIAGVTYHGNGDGKIEWGSTPIGPNGVANEDEIVWNHLSKAGFYPGNLEYSPSDPTAAIPRNLFGGIQGIAFDNQYASSTATSSIRHSIKTGNQIPVQFLFEIDTKMDDGDGLTGAFRFSSYAYSGAAPVGPPSPSGCIDVAGRWQLAVSTTATNCGGAFLM